MNTPTVTTNIIAPKGPYQHLPFPDTTPWGKPQQTDVLMYGESSDGTRVPVLWQTHTAGHGGTRVHRELAARFLNGIPPECHSYGGSRLWYEEDAESCIPLYIYFNGIVPTHHLFNLERPYPRQKLLESVQRWMPNAVDKVRELAAAFDAALVAEGKPLRSPLPLPLHIN